MRHAESEDGDDREYLVERPSVVERGEGAERGAERKPEQCRRYRQDEGVAERIQELAGDLQPGKHRGAEIAAQHPAEPGEVLHVERFIEAELDLEPLDDLLWRLGRQQNIERVAGDQMDQAEGDDRDTEQD